MKQKQRLKLIDLAPKDIKNISDYSIFRALKSVLNLDFYTDDFISGLEIYYYYSRSSFKYISSFCDNYIKNYSIENIDGTYTPTNEEWSTMANIIANDMKLNIESIYNAYSTSYNPIDNYQFTEETVIQTNTERTFVDKYNAYNSPAALPRNENTTILIANPDDNRSSTKRHGIINNNYQDLIKKEINLRTLSIYDLISDYVDKYLTINIY